MAMISNIRPPAIWKSEMVIPSIMNIPFPMSKNTTVKTDAVIIESRRILLLADTSISSVRDIYIGRTPIASKATNKGIKVITKFVNIEFKSCPMLHHYNQLFKLKNYENNLQVDQIVSCIVGGGGNVEGAFYSSFNKILNPICSKWWSFVKATVIA